LIRNLRSNNVRSGDENVSLQYFVVASARHSMADVDVVQTVSPTPSLGTFRYTLHYVSEAPR
jgi:hypothetical protein